MTRNILYWGKYCRPSCWATLPSIPSAPGWRRQVSDAFLFLYRPHSWYPYSWAGIFCANVTQQSVSCLSSDTLLIGRDTAPRCALSLMVHLPTFCANPRDVKIPSPDQTREVTYNYQVRFTPASAAHRILVDPVALYPDWECVFISLLALLVVKEASRFYVARLQG